ncbi:MAG TPA: class I SAM-dependent methyltransferase [Anaerolineae bacterium]|nr:class I SAM-dependent methyltransferase [Anaerolineae bacterium]
MTPWYETSFGLKYLELYAHRDEHEATEDIQSIVELVALSRDEPLLDLCCGAGRHLKALRDMGFTRLVGLDLSRELLDVAAERLAADEASNSTGHVQLVRADMRFIPYVNCLACILSLFTSFGYFEQDRENSAVLLAAYASLKPGGTFLIDYLSKEHVVAHLIACDEMTVGPRRIRNVRRLTDGARRVEKTITITMGDGVAQEFHESVRLYLPHEMVAMLEDAGFVAIRTYGSLKGERYTPESERLVVVAQKGQAG